MFSFAAFNENTHDSWFGTVNTNAHTHLYTYKHIHTCDVSAQTQHLCSSEDQTIVLYNLIRYPVNFFSAD